MIFRNEFERKFIVKNFPINIEFDKIEHVKQWYLSKPLDLLSNRIRLYDDGRCYYDEKIGHGIKRFKKGEKCDFNEYKDIVTDLPFIEKTRYKKYINNILLIIDKFENGLILAEIESDDLKKLEEFIPFEWMINEVTNIKEYENNYIACKY
jgi:CYTH domain-containing protein